MENPEEIRTYNTRLELALREHLGSTQGYDVWTPKGFFPVCGIDVVVHGGHGRRDVTYKLDTLKKVPDVAEKVRRRIEKVSQSKHEWKARCEALDAALRAKGLSGIVLRPDSVRFEGEALQRLLEALGI